MTKHIIKSIAIDDKTIIWFQNKNRYVVLENTTATIIHQISEGKSVQEISANLSEEINAPQDKMTDFILDIKKEFFLKEKVESEQISDYKDLRAPSQFKSNRFYQINNLIFKMSFSSEKELSLIHPKFAHLEIEKTVDYHHNFQVFTNHNYIVLFVNDQFIGSWSKPNVHYFQGKFSMELIQKIHDKKEEEWMGVFHASALSNSKKSILFLGDSGNGKSTSLALLQAHGYTCLADDFVPIAANNKEVYSFPAAISIKKNSLPTLLPIYPELKTTAEYHFKELNKIVRFLRPNNSNFYSHLPCKDLVFIKYQKDAKLSFSKISKIDAFQKLVPDSWLSPKPKNAEIFLDWFKNLNCYELTYSKNSEMINEVTQLFKNDL